MDGIIIDFIKITKDDITREGVKLTKKTRRKDGLLFGHIKEREKYKNMSPELYKKQKDS
jgi:hypothetical protein